ncbi:unnamed protein product [marine sediment metagenome]|uniref:Uncharacterized protein n=1 Tax=marine sediment metagenome TaxID=412755 RepID=X1B8J6_9ZZZZ
MTEDRGKECEDCGKMVDWGQDLITCPDCGGHVAIVEMGF